MNKWFNEVCLLNQQCVWDNKKTIKSICEEIDNVVIKEFVRFECGEGLKKEETKKFCWWGSGYYFWMILWQTI